MPKQCHAMKHDALRVADVYQGVTALFVASLEGHQNVVQMLLSVNPAPGTTSHQLTPAIITPHTPCT